jgi:hypothetical protein
LEANNPKWDVAVPKAYPYLVFIGTNSHRIDPTLHEIELTDRLTGKNPQGLQQFSNVMTCAVFFFRVDFHIQKWKFS